MSAAIKKIILMLMMLLSSTTYLLAQQDAMYTQYMFNTLAINPAYAGSRNVATATALYRKQWVGIEGAPITQTLSFDTPLANNKVGLGFQVFNDAVGITKTTGVFATYAYRILMDNSTLAFGIQAGASRFSANYQRVDLGSDGTPDAAYADNVTKLLPNFGLGIFFNTDNFYAGLSLPHFLNNSLDDKQGFVSEGLVARQYLHLFFSIGYVFSLNDDLKLKPNILFKGVRGAPVQADINMNLYMFDVVSFGLSYRTEADISALMEVQLNKKIRLGYAYDTSTTSLAKQNSGSHELMLRVQFGEKGSRAILNPRYF